MCKALGSVLSTAKNKKFANLYHFIKFLFRKEQNVSDSGAIIKLSYLDVIILTHHDISIPMV
jgi:hypothetical protein